MDPKAYTKADGVELKEHIECRLLALQEYFEMKFCAIEKATELARTAMEKRLDGMNEFRDALKDQSSRMATSSELSVQISRIDKELADLKAFKNQTQGAASQNSVIVAYVFSAVGIVMGVISLLMR